MLKIEVKEGNKEFFFAVLMLCLLISREINFKWIFKQILAIH